MDTPTSPPSEPPAPRATRRVEFLSPLEPAWARMRRMLFPFDIRTWCTVGFGCFLAKLAEGGFSGGGGVGGGLDDAGAAPGSRSGRLLHDGLSLDRLMERSGAWWSRILGLDVIEVAVLTLALAVAVLLVLLILYLSARGHFVFLDNVALERAAFRLPWREYRDEAHSLFLWRLGFFALLIGGVLVAVLLPALLLISLEDTAYEAVGLVLAGGWALVIFLPLILAAGYVDLWLTDFVVPMMFQHRLTTTEAWRRFLPLVRRHAFDFLAWGLLILALHVLVGLAVLAAGVATCCIGLLLVIIPYVGTVLLLPLHLTYRAYSLEFLAQYGDDFWRFPTPWMPEAPPVGGEGTDPSEPPPEQPPESPTTPS